MDARVQGLLENAAWVRTFHKRSSGQVLFADAVTVHRKSVDVFFYVWPYALFGQNRASPYSKAHSFHLIQLGMS